ncbi:MAG: energy-coupling factor ABC transporter permease [Pseudonocardiales bacterium]|nr:energy-coupling factor ABC transporter permease [Pseudonocardiales bacterium]MBV9030223.1 energy-coupling factor ABC transporter permease [Pseudonocardiales bacterium]MBW0009386.1 energy-coupling factor ABC transporter permease [Pseudonocardiales bacterium]
MHIPDGFVSPAVAVTGAAVAVAGLGVCLRRAGLDLSERQLPLAGLAAAFFLVLGAPIIPVAVGTEGHLLGGTLAVALLGPWLGPVVVTVVTVVQALFLGDGGLSTLGVNVVNLALVPAVVGYPVLLGLRRLLPRCSTGTAVAAGVAAAVSVLAAAALFTAEYAVGGAAGIPLRTVAFSTFGVYAVVAVLEGLVTALVVRGLLAVRADLVQVAP